MTTDKCFSCKRKGKSLLCTICGIGMNGEREYYTRKPITNADRVRNMDDYDLAIFLENVSCKHADTESWLDWLKQEVEYGDSEL